MKNKAAVLALGLSTSLVTGQAFSTNERTFTWYSSRLGNQLVVDTTLALFS
ncbi:hypothetical protein [Spartinivicinus poritis]|uniref:Uncharacterized protein n=1 Tax=Spartinivicinus poritis TaxID=2994640 RepID=A0ABT5U3V2_9GAMM|nr:hypothetical protein [Spartinivicinus sp. A2-2]MDE1461050.1 hypothetical protein [Spartinivicinus sp. A2-2]